MKQYHQWQDQLHGRSPTTPTPPPPLRRHQHHPSHHNFAFALAKALRQRHVTVLQMQTFENPSWLPYQTESIRLVEAHYT